MGPAPAIPERGPQDVARECEPVAAAAEHGLRREIAHSILVVGRILRRGNERGGRILHVDVDDGVDDLVAPRLVQAGLQPLVEGSGWNQGDKIVDGFHQRVDATRRVVILPQAVSRAQLLQAAPRRSGTAPRPGAPTKCDPPQQNRVYLISSAEPDYSQSHPRSRDDAPSPI